MKKRMENDDKLCTFNPDNYCAIYVIGTTKSDKNNIDDQIQYCREKAHELNLIISEEYFSFQFTTKLEPSHKPDLKKLIHDLKNNKFKSLIVFKKDYLAKKTSHFKEIKYLCEQNNIKLIYAVSDDLYTFDPNHYCAIYARRSIKNNKDNIVNQLQCCRDKAHELNLIISEEYSDFESATRFEPFHRPGFKKLIYDLEK